MADSILYNDDCVNAMKNIKSGSVDLILTDPPYNRNSNIRSYKDLDE